MLFKVKKGITQITFEGDFIEGGATVTATLDDVPEDIRMLIKEGVFDKDAILAKYSSNGSREKRMVLRAPFTKLMGEDKILQMHKFENQYDEDDLVLDCMMNDSAEFPWDDDSDANVAESSDAGNDMDWLNDL